MMDRRSCMVPASNDIRPGHHSKAPFPQHLYCSRLRSNQYQTRLALRMATEERNENTVFQKTRCKAVELFARFASDLRSVRKAALPSLMRKEAHESHISRPASRQ